MNLRALLAVTVATALADIVLGQAPSPTPYQYDLDLLQWVEHADVKADFRRNVEEKHDTRFIAVNGISSNMVLGATSALVQKHGFWRIEGTGCVSTPLHLKAVNYARQYNMMLVKYLDSHSAH